MYLPSSLEPGTSFFIQLLPSISGNLWLHGRIWSRGDLVVGGKLFENVVECLYKLDLGVQVITDDEGNAIGNFHSYMYGTIHFAPEVGPIKSLERWNVKDSSIQGGGGRCSRAPSSPRKRRKYARFFCLT